MAYADKEKRKQWYRDAYAKNPEPHKQKLRDRFAANKQYLLDILGDKCCFCGSKDRIEFDHINPLHKTTRCSVLSMGRAKLEAEIPNLRSVCRACHLKRSNAQRKAAWDLFKELDLDKQNELIQAYLN